MRLSRLLPAIGGFLLAAALPGATGALAAELTVAVSGLRNQNGQALIALHDNSANFPNKWERALAVKRLPARDGAAATFENVAPGRYAVIVVHDEDGNGEMTKTFVGLPVEGFGTSNNPSFFGPPRFGPAVFDLLEDTSLSVRIVYF